MQINIYGDILDEKAVKENRDFKKWWKGETYVIRGGPQCRPVRLQLRGGNVRVPHHAGLEQHPKTFFFFPRPDHFKSNGM